MVGERCFALAPHLNGGGTAKGNVTKENTATIAASSMENNVVHPENSMTTTISQAVKETTEQCTVLLSDPRSSHRHNNLLSPLILTGGGGAQGTSATVGLALTASAVGQLYMWMSAIQVLGKSSYQSIYRSSREGFCHCSGWNVDQFCNGESSSNLCVWYD